MAAGANAIVSAATAEAARQLFVETIEVFLFPEVAAARS
jgi:hypothetical protein